MKPIEKGTDHAKAFVKKAEELVKIEGVGFVYTLLEEEFNN